MFVNDFSGLYRGTWNQPGLLQGQQIPYSYQWGGFPQNNLGFGGNHPSFNTGWNVPFQPTGLNNPGVNTTWNHPYFQGYYNQPTTQGTQFTGQFNQGFHTPSWVQGGQMSGGFPQGFGYQQGMTHQLHQGLTDPQYNFNTTPYTSNVYGQGYTPFYGCNIPFQGYR